MNSTRHVQINFTRQTKRWREVRTIKPSRALFKCQVKEGKYPVLSIIDDKEFDEERKRLVVRSKQLNKQDKEYELNAAKKR